MKSILFSFLLSLTGYTVFSQEFKRTTFNYNELANNYKKCDNMVLMDLDEAVNDISEYNSTKAVSIAKALYDLHKDCAETYQVYGLSLFRNGKVLEGLAVTDSAIAKFGSVPDLLNQRVAMELELYENGVGQKNVDGNSIYTSGKNALPYDDEQFKKENLNAALTDLEYLTAKFPDNLNNLFAKANLYQAIGEYEKSNAAFMSLLGNPDYQMAALFNIAVNYVSLEKYDEAEKEFLELLGLAPKHPQILNEISNFYRTKDDKPKEEEYERKSIFYSSVPDFADIEFTNENYEMVQYFAAENLDYKDKFKKLSEIKKTKSQDFLIDVCMTILKMHTNHGNGLEDEAAKILIKIGKPSLDKTHQLLNSNVSTCTVSNLGDIMATIKDESSWVVFTDYLPNVANMPSTLIPPIMPEMIIKFDPERGLKEVLKVVKSFISEKKMEDHEGMFSGIGSDYVFYMPLQKMDKKKVINAAKELGFTDNEIATLKEKIKE